MKALKTNCKLILFLFFACGCNQANKTPLPQFTPPPPPSIRPPSSAPNFIPNIYELQINPVPSPLNINGNLPYVVWVNGEKLPLTPQQSVDLANSLNLNVTPPKNTAKIHQGEGWLYPLKLKNEQNSNNRKYRQEKASPF